MFNWNLLNVFHFTVLEKGQGTIQWPKPSLLSIFLSRFSFMDIHNSQDNRGRGSLSLSLTALYHFHLLHRHVDISQAITAESLPMHIASSQTWTRNLFFPNASCHKLCGKQLLVSVFKFSFHLTTQFTLKI